MILNRLVRITCLIFLAISLLIVGACEMTPTQEDIEFQTTDGMLQYRLDEGSWHEVADLDELREDQDFREIEIRVEENILQWRHEGDNEWHDLYDLTLLEGKDGREIELRVNNKAIEWRYHDQSSWNSLIGLDVLKGGEGCSAYELYRKHYPEYDGDEVEWLDDLVNGRLAEKNTATVVFETEGGEMQVGDDDTVFVTIGDTIALPVPIKDYHSFKGWYSGFDVNDARFTTLTPVSNDIMLYASWQFDADEWLVDLNGASSWEKYLDILQESHLDSMESGEVFIQGVLEDVHSNQPFESVTDFENRFADTLTFRMATQNALAHVKGLDVDSTLDLDLLLMDVHTALLNGNLDYLHTTTRDDMLELIETHYIALQNDENLSELRDLLISMEITRYEDILDAIDTYLPDVIMVESDDDLQTVIDTATPGDIIEVKPGTYEGPLVIKSENITIRSSMGSSETIIDAQGNNSALSIEASNVTFQGFSITNWEQSGVLISEVHNVRFEENHVEADVSFLKNALYPLWMWNAKDISIVGNTIIVPTNDIYNSFGVSAEAVSSLLIQDNTLIGGVYPDEKYDSYAGIYLLNYLEEAMEDVVIEGNSIDGFEHGIELWLHENFDILHVTIQNNHLKNNVSGMVITEWEYNGSVVTFETFADNTFENNDVQVNNTSTFDIDLNLILSSNHFIPESEVDGNLITPIESDNE